MRSAELDLVLVATMTPDEITPHAAPLIASAIGAYHAGAMDIGAACTAFLSALALATSHIEAGRAQAALVIGADFMSRVIDPDDTTTAGIFGDGAGAVVLRARTGDPHARTSPPSGVKGGNRSSFELGMRSSAAGDRRATGSPERARAGRAARLSLRCLACPTCRSSYNPGSRVRRSAPPATQSVWPVMKLASSEARNATARPMSEAAPQRPKRSARSKCVPQS